MTVWLWPSMKRSMPSTSAQIWSEVMLELGSTPSVPVRRCSRRPRPAGPPPSGGRLHGVRYSDVVEVSGHDEIEGVRCAEPEDPQPVAVPLDYPIRFEHQLPRVRVAQVGAYRIEFKLSCVVQIRLEPVVELMVPWDHEVISHRIQYVHGRAAVGEHRVSGTLERVPRVQHEDGGSAGLEVLPERCHPCEPEVLVIVPWVSLVCMM